VDVVCGRFGGPVENAWLAALMSTAGDAVTSIVELRPGLPIRPATLLVAPLTGRTAAVAELIRGPGEAAAAAAVARAVEEGTIPRAAVPDVLILLRVDLGATSDSPDDVFANVLATTQDALRSAVRDSPTVDEVLAEAGHPWNAGYHRHRN
jgi:5,6,7,8-tetrahydromethanopterin hydro-lyase